MRNAWSPEKASAPLNVSFQANGGFTGKIFKKNIGGIFAITYSKTNKYLKLLNRANAIDNIFVVKPPFA